MQDKTIRLLIADDHDLVRRGLRRLLEREPGFEVIGEATDGSEAIEMCRSLTPDLVLMDVRMPNMDGLEATRIIKGEQPGIGVLMVTMHDNPDYMLEAIRAGAAGYVLKDASREDMTTSIRRAVDGEFPMDPDVAARLLKRLARETPEEPAEPANLPDPLTPGELEVLELVTLGQTNIQIARDLDISVETIKTHVEHLISKLGVSDRTQAAVRAVELELV